MLSPMDPDLTGFSPAQQHALLELLILAMFADGQLTTAEDPQLQPLFAALGQTDATDRQNVFAAAVTRLRPYAQSLFKAKDQALLLMGNFTDRRQQKTVSEAVQKRMDVNHHVTSWENTLLMELRLKFHL